MVQTACSLEGDLNGIDKSKAKDTLIEELKKVAYEKFGNAGMGGELIVNLDDAIAIIDKFLVS